MTPDPDAIQMLAAALHGMGAHRLSKPYSEYSARWHQVHERRAKALLRLIDDAGYELKPKES